jgi:cellulose synthase/poly-beta-1,6-N-acetylglucosamine synthase-like glycosyltransferase
MMAIGWGVLMSFYLMFYAMMILRFARGWRLFLQGSPSDELLSNRTLVTEDQPSGKQDVLLSVIVAARNEEGRMKPLLEALLSQDFGLNFRGAWEIVWVDDHSTDGSAALAEKFAIAHPELKFRVLRRNGSDTFPLHKKGAVALGVASAHGECILVTDADCVPGPGWCRAMFHTLTKDSSTMFVAGAVRLAPCTSAWQRSQALEFMSLNAIAASSIALGQPIISNGGNMAFRRSVFTRINPYDGNMRHPGGDDDLLMHRIVVEYGAQAVAFCSDTGAMVDTPPVAGLRDFLQQRIRWISKQSAYPDPWVSLTLKAVWFMQAMIFMGLAAALVGWIRIGWISLGAWWVKGIMDGLYTRQAASFYKVHAGWGLLLLTHLWYLPYTLVAGLMGYRGRFEWKGRAYRT